MILSDRDIIQALEDGLTDHGAVVPAPPDDHPIELLDQVFLASHLVLPNDRTEPGIVPFDRRAAGFDEGLEGCNFPVMYF